MAEMRDKGSAVPKGIKPVAAGLAVAFAPYSVQQGMVLLFFDPARTWAAVGASVLGALVVCGAVQAASWLILRRICVK